MMPLPSFAGFNHVPAAAGGVDWSDYDTTGDKAPVVYESIIVNNAICEIDDTRAFILFRNNSTGYLTARIASIDSNGNVTFGTTSILKSVVANRIHVTPIDSSNVLVAYQTSSVVYAMVVPVSGTTVGTPGTEQTIVSLSVSFLTGVALSTTKGFITYTDGADTSSHAVYIAISGTSITVGNSLELTGSQVFGFDISSIANDQAIAVYFETPGNLLVAKLLSVSGTTPQVDDTLTLESAGGSDRCTTATINDNDIIVTYQYGGTAYAVVVREGSGSLSKGTKVTVDTNSYENLNIVVPDTGHAVFTSTINSGNFNTRVLEISGTSLTTLTLYTNATSIDREHTRAAAIGTDWIAVVYEDDDSSSDGTIEILGV